MPNSKPTDNTSPRVLVGVVVGAHGIRGQMKLKTFTTNPDDILSYGALTNVDGTKRYEISIDAATKAGLVISIKSVKDRNEAERMRGTEFHVVKDRLPEPDHEDEFFYEDLVGLAVNTESGEKLGEITAVYNFGASDVVELRMTASGKKEMFPFTKAIFPTLNLAEKSCVAHLPEMVEAPKKEKTDD